MDFFSIEYALLSMQSALLREITPDLRAVIIDLDKNEQILYACFYYDGEVSEKMIDLWDCVICEASASLGPDCFVKAQVARLDYPQKIPSGGYCAYLRREHDVLFYKKLFRSVKITEMSIGYALLAVQNALLGVVTSELRAVVIDFDKERSLLYIRFYYDGEVLRDRIDLWQSAIAETGAAVGTNCVLDGGVERADYPKTFPVRGRYAYFRKE
jgi:hypothetical protein